MNEETGKFIDECADIAKRYDALYEMDFGLCSIDSMLYGPSVQLLDKNFLSIFGDSFEVFDRHDAHIPLRLEHVENGVKFFCITDRNPREGT